MHAFDRLFDWGEASVVSCLGWQVSSSHSEGLFNRSEGELNCWSTHSFSEAASAAPDPVNKAEHGCNFSCIASALEIGVNFNDAGALFPIAPMLCESPP